MSGNYRGIDGGASGRPIIGHLAVVSSTGTDTFERAARTNQSSRSSFGGAVGRSSVSPARKEAVAAVAARYDNFEDALMPMLLAAGVNGKAAKAVEKGVLSNPNLRAEAEAAFRRAKMTAV